jgi:uncharacterized glyoxalase superfamily protein PhnB
MPFDNGWRKPESAGRDRAAAFSGCSYPDALYVRAKAAGAEVSMELTDQDYGSRDFAVRDPEGNQWNFGTYEPT